ncbi:23S rRNA (guanine745-N1)-methyltransferase [Paenibacillus algorifonticola]|uniref:23S rRNA (Guanine745-N1)-methyltransferase n=1 Tax=Paenibacillus algorifonticola TaxID=684063 RepID=A0A1I2GBB1_9BACL|nr:methyltransferase domain-containing protein [Paenibacillus algorifonticola]SFF14463.1 23S rRNA (guanine745-N1)-methyltransferase [Paenibacillus algorifonticola]
MRKNRKKTAVALTSPAYSHLLRCPICASSMQLRDGRSLVCSSKHSFDLSKHGYVHFLSRPMRTKYEKPLFEARKKVMDSGFFAPVLSHIAERITASWQARAMPLRLLDAGCGEGSHLSVLQQQLSRVSDAAVLASGLDISKDAIALAAKNNGEAFWCVADLAHSPFADRSFDFIVNILSPSNYAEFQRLLAGTGNVIKVFPGPDYLKELRSLLYSSTDSSHSMSLERNVYDNLATIARFSEYFEVLGSQRLHYSFLLQQPLIEPFIAMTPLSWGMKESLVQQIKQRHTLEVTVDLTVIIGGRKAAVY